jgi:Flp pilus assembly protein CpaB
VTGALAAPRIGWRRQWIPAHLRRRLLAAVLAGAAVVLALSSIRSPTTPPTSIADHAQTTNPLVAGLDTGHVAAPIRLIDPGVGALLHAGAYVDVLAAATSVAGSAEDPQAAARVIAHGVRVLAVPTASAAAAGGANGSLVVLRVTRSEAQILAGAEAGGRLSIVLVRG